MVDWFTGKEGKDFLSSNCGRAEAAPASPREHLHIPPLGFTTAATQLSVPGWGSYALTCSGVVISGSVRGSSAIATGEMSGSGTNFSRLSAGRHGSALNLKRTNTA